MVVRLLKARYFSRSSYLDAVICANSQFYMTESILAGRDILTRGLRWQIRDGIQAHIQLDPWIPLPLTFKIVSQQQILPLHAKVLKLNNTNFKSWNIEFFKDVLFPVNGITNLIPGSFKRMFGFDTIRKRGFIRIKVSIALLLH